MKLLKLVEYLLMVVFLSILTIAVISIKQMDVAGVITGILLIWASTSIAKALNALHRKNNNITSGNAGGNKNGF